MKMLFLSSSSSNILLLWSLLSVSLTVASEEYGSLQQQSQQQQQQQQQPQRRLTKAKTGKEVMEELRSEEFKAMFNEWLAQASEKHPLPLSKDHDNNDDENENRRRQQRHLDKQEGDVIMARKDKADHESTRSMTRKSMMSSSSSTTSTMSPASPMMTMEDDSSKNKKSTKAPTNYHPTHSTSKGKGGGGMMGQHQTKGKGKGIGMMMSTKQPSSSSKGKGKGKASKTDSPTAFPSAEAALGTPPPSASSMPSFIPSTFPSFSVFPTGEPSFDLNCAIPEDLGGNCTEQIISGLDYECVPDCFVNSATLFFDDLLVNNTHTLNVFCQAGCPCSDECYCKTRDCLDEYQACFDTAFNEDQSCNCLGASATTDPFANLVLCDVVQQDDWGVPSCVQECEAKFDEVAAETDGCFNFCQCVVEDSECFEVNDSVIAQACCIFRCEGDVRSDYDAPALCLP